MPAAKLLDRLRARRSTIIMAGIAAAIWALAALVGCEVATPAEYEAGDISGAWREIRAAADPGIHSDGVAASAATDTLDGRYK